MPSFQTHNATTWNENKWCGKKARRDPTQTNFFLSVNASKGLIQKNNLFKLFFMHNLWTIFSFLSLTHFLFNAICEHPFNRSMLRGWKNAPKKNTIHAVSLWKQLINDSKDVAFLYNKHYLSVISLFYCWPHLECVEWKSFKELFAGL